MLVSPNLCVTTYKDNSVHAMCFITSSEHSIKKTRCYLFSILKYNNFNFQKFQKSALSIACNLKMEGYSYVNY